MQLDWKQVTKAQRVPPPWKNKNRDIDPENPTEQDKFNQQKIWNELKLQKENSELKLQLSESQQQLKKTQTELLKAKGQLDEMMAQMSHIMKRDNRGGIESPGDLFTPMKIAKKLENFFNDEAVPIVAMFGDKEIKGIKFISGIMQKSYTFCATRAEVQMLAFTPAFPLEEEIRDTDQAGHTLAKALTKADINELYLLRWKTAISDEMRNRIKKDFTDITYHEIDEEIRQVFKENESTNTIKPFLAGCAEISWLICTCHPSLTLRFDVTDKIYENWIQTHFKKYTTKEPVTKKNQPKGYVTYLVWPALITTDEGNLLQPGEVITVDYE